MHFEEFVIMQPGEFTNFDFIVVVPDDHPDNVEYHIELNALDRGSPLADGTTGVQMQQNPRIYIGENPVYTYETPPQVEITKEEIIVRSTEVKDDGYMPEPIMDKEPATPGDLPKCRFLEWFLSLFGIKSDCV